MCTVAVWADNGVAVLSGRTLDWKTDMATNLWQLPRGVERHGLSGGQANSLNWQSKYGSVVSMAYDISTADGINEKGFAAHILWLVESDYGVNSPDKKGISVGMWAQFMLDNFATVNEAVEYWQKKDIQLVTKMVPQMNVLPTVHLLIEDSSGDVAVIEYIDGKANIYHGKQYRVMTNSPSYSEQLTNLKRYKGFGGEDNLPGSTQAADRYVRAAYYLEKLIKPDNPTIAIAEMMSVMRSVAEPFSEFDPSLPNVSPTRWFTICDHTNGVYFYQNTLSPYPVWINYKKIDFDSLKVARKLDMVSNPDRIGDNTDNFVDNIEPNWALV